MRVSLKQHVVQGNWSDEGAERLFDDMRGSSEETPVELLKGQQD
jgi:hypothetical protein